MGAGLLIFALCILIFIPIFIVSGVYLYRYKKASATEIKILRPQGIKARSAKIGLFGFYGLALLVIYYEFWLTLLAKLLGFGDEPGIIYRFLRGVMSWDNLDDILIYWFFLVCIFLFVFLVVSIKQHNYRLYDTNKYVATVFLVGLYPFIVLSFIGWAGSWEPQKRFYGSDDILVNFGYSNKAIEQQLGIQRVEVLQSIMSWANAYDIPNKWLPRNILKLDSAERLIFRQV